MLNIGHGIPNDLKALRRLEIDEFIARKYKFLQGPNSEEGWGQKMLDNIETQESDEEDEWQPRA